MLPHTPSRQGELRSARTLLEIASSPNLPIPCGLIGIAQGRIHLSTNAPIERGARAILRFNRLNVAGVIDTCQQRGDQYRATFIAENRRSAPRFPIDESGMLSIAGEDEWRWSPCQVTDLSSSGLGLDTILDVEPGAMVCVQTQFMLAAGQIRYRIRGPGGNFHVGLAITELLSERAARRERGLRHRLAELVLGRRIPTL